MKIPDSPFHFERGTAVRPSSHHHPFMGWDAVDMNFLDMMTTLRQADGHGSATPVDDTLPSSDAAKRVSDDEQTRNSKTVTPHVPQLQETIVRMIRAEEDMARLQMNQDLSLLHSDLTSEDASFLERVVLTGLPYVGGVPLSQVMATDTYGRPDMGTLNLSKGLSDMIEQAYKTRRPIRVDLDNNASVILKFHDGKVSAEFLTPDPAMAMTLKQQMEELRQRLLAKNLPLGDLSYRQDDGRRKDQPDEPNTNPDQREHHSA